jgi:hypothetical protein
MWNNIEAFALKRREGLDTFAQFSLAFLLAVIGMTGVLINPIYGDETINLGDLYNLSRGLHCHSDFWCVYPVTGLEFFRLLFGAYMGSIYVLLGLRLCCLILMTILFYWVVSLYTSLKLSRTMALLLCIAYFSDPNVLYASTELKTDAISNLCMMGALIVLMSSGSQVSYFLIGMLATLSLFIMPKGIYLLIVLLLAALFLSYRSLKWKGVLMIAAGCFSSLLVIQILCMFSGTSIWQDAIYTSIQQYKFTSKLIQIGDQRDTYSFLNNILVPFFLRNWGLCAIYSISIVVWLLTIARASLQSICTGACIIIGSVIYMMKVREIYDQYMNPFLLPLLLFPALALSAIPSKRAKAIFTVAIIGTCAFSLLARAPHLLANGKPAQLMHDLNEIDLLEHVLKKDDTVLSAPTFPPLQPPLTFVTFEEVPPLYEDLVVDPGIRRNFNVDTLSSALEKSSPALIDLNFAQFPPSWSRIIQRYIQANFAKYQLATVAGHSCILLKDRLPTSMQRQ